MEYQINLPFRKYIDKQIPILDISNEQIGFAQRKYKGFWDKVLHFLPISFLHKSNVYGESAGDRLQIFERSFKENLKKLKWDVYLNEEEASLLEDQTKITTNIRLVYHKNNKEYVFKKDAFNRTCQISIKGEQTTCAEILHNVPASLIITLKTEDLTPLEIISVYYIMYIVYL